MRVVPAVIPPMGPLVVTMEQNLASYDFQIDPAYWNTIQVEVRSDDGTLIEGDLETLEGFSPRLWRPAAPLPAGDYTATARIVPEDHCTGYEQEFELEVHEALELPAPPEVLIATEARSRAEASATNYVCCDGAIPYRPDPPGSGCFNPPTPLKWQQGFCTPLTHDHWLRVDASLDESATGFFTLREVTTGDRPAAGSTALMLEVDAPGCLEFEVLDLHAGISSFTAWCPDDAASLGVLARVEVDAELAAQCEGPAYVCGMGWYAPCSLWPDGGSIDPLGSSESTGEDSTGEDGPDTDSEDPAAAGSDDDAGGCTLGDVPEGGFILLLPALAAGVRRRSHDA